MNKYKMIIHYRKGKTSKTLKAVLFAVLSFSLLTALCSPSYAAFKEGSWATRPAGMGGAFIAVSDDANAILYNPAGIAQCDTIEANFMYSKLFASLDGVNMGVKQFALVMPMKRNGNFGFAWKSFTSENEYQEDALYANYATRFGENLYSGINLKYLGHKYILDSRSGADSVFDSGNSKYQPTIDLGAIYKFSGSWSGNSLSIGCSAKNITRPDIGLKSEDKVPMELGVGIASRLGNKVVSALDINYRVQDWGKDIDKVTLRLGEERRFFDGKFAVRYGGNNSELTAGVGFLPRIGDMECEFNYAFIMPLEVRESQGTHHMSFTIRFINNR